MYKLIAVFVVLLQLLFIGLKLAQLGVVKAWNWLYVFSPVLVPIALFILFGIGVFAFSIIFYKEIDQREKWVKEAKAERNRKAGGFTALLQKQLDLAEQARRSN